MGNFGSDFCILGAKQHPNEAWELWLGRNCSQKSKRRRWIWTSNPRQLWWHNGCTRGPSVLQGRSLRPNAHISDSAGLSSARRGCSETQRAASVAEEELTAFTTELRRGNTWQLWAKWRWGWFWRSLGCSTHFSCSSTKTIKQRLKFAFGHVH